MGTKEGCAAKLGGGESGRASWRKGLRPGVNKVKGGEGYCYLF